MGAPGSTTAVPGEGVHVARDGPAVVQTSRVGSVLSATLTWLLMGFLFAPVLVVVLFAFQGSSRLGLPFDGPSTRWFAQAFSDEVVLSSLTSSLRVGLGAASGAVLVGTLTAYAITRFRLRFTGVVTPLALAPIMLPQLFVGLSLLIFLSSIGIRPSLMAVTLAHLIYVFPYALLVLLARLTAFDVSIEDAARDLGASAWQAFWKVTFPAIWPVLLAGGLLAFALSFDEFPIALFLVGSDATLPITIWSRLRRVIDPSVNALATSLVAVVLASLAVGGALLWSRVGRGRKR